MLTGKWKNFEELENDLCIEELEAIVAAMREREHRQFKMMAAVQGINIDEDESSEDRLTVDDIKSRLAARQSGKSDEQWEIEELGLEMEIEE